MQRSDLAAIAAEAGFDLCGFARAEPIPARVLTDWLDAGLHADMYWMSERVAERLDPELLLRGARTVIALGCNYYRDGAEGPVAQYARGRDYHATMRDRLRGLRRRLAARLPGVDSYACVDTGAVMEKVWAARGGLGFVGQNGCFITEKFGSYVVLAVMIIDREADAYCDGPPDSRCGNCNLCVTACPTGALLGEGRVDSRRCLSFQTIENRGEVPEALRPAFAGLVFGCDICQAVCPLNTAPLRAGDRFAPREVANLSLRELASLTSERYRALTQGTAVARAQYDGLRRNAILALGASGDLGALPLVEPLAGDVSPLVREAARWAISWLERLKADS